MATASSNPMSFLSCFVQEKSVFRLVSQIDELKDHGSTSSRLMKWVRAEKKWYAHDLDWHATRICAPAKPSPHLIAVGPSGIVYAASPSSSAEEEIDPTDDGPRRRGDIRDLRIIDDEVYAAGMGRQVYRRTGANQWTREDAGVVQQRGVIAVSGFNAIDGLSKNDVYAVGFGGEIWRRLNRQWRQIDSPTNVVLHRVRAVEPNLVYACGQGGVLLRGHGDQWDRIDHDATEEDLWGMEWYRERLYVAGDDGLFRLEPGDRLARVNARNAAATYRHLHAADGVLLSSAPKSVLYTEDGSRWNDITP